MNASTESFWNKTGEKGHYPRLKEDVEAEALIVGGGITGVTAAYCLALKGASPVLVEAGNLCSGTTGNTTGKITIQHGLLLADLMEKQGAGVAEGYVRSQLEAVDFVRSASAVDGIDCHLKECPSYVFASSKAGWDAVRREFEAAKRLGVEAELVEGPDFPVPNLGMVGFRGQAVLHPVRYASGLARAAASKGARIFCGTKAVEIEEKDGIVSVRCDGGALIRAKSLVVATGYPVYAGPNMFFARLYPKRSYAVAVKAKKDWPEGSFISAEEPIRSFRGHVEKGERLLIVAGDGHYTGRSGAGSSLHFENLMQFADSLALVEGVVAMWSAQDYETPDKLPYIGRVSPGSNVYVATGYKKWGLSTGTLAGLMLAELIIEGKSRWEELYSVLRADLVLAPVRTLSEVFSQVGELVKSKLEGTGDMRGLEPGQGRVVRFNGKRAGIYRGLDDDIVILDITCVHMGTELNFNSAEKTWDCPAHGGRYAYDGRPLEGPPKKPLPVLFRGKYSDLIDGGEEGA